jgi:DNA-binding MarR family transcriptional regulator
MEPVEIYRSLIRLHILLETANAPGASSAVAGKLADRGYMTSPASARRILREFEARGYVISKETRNSRSRRVYRITSPGRQKLRDAKKKLRALMEVFGSAGGAGNALQRPGITR